ncbi:MAG: hypothetical protein GXP25_04880 [Planctomycetes bacterium]|nr:hypothetical protein [Planctomycetota bacterium]
MAQEKRPLPNDDPNRGDARAQQRANAMAARLATLATNLEQAASKLATLEKALDGMKGKAG